MSDPGGLSILRTVGGLLATKRFTWQPVAQVWLRSTSRKCHCSCDIGATAGMFSGCPVLLATIIVRRI